MLLAVMFTSLLFKADTEAAKRLFNIVVKDGYTTQTIEMRYGRSPYGYTAYHASQSAIYVNPKAKRVTFRVRKNTSSQYGNFKFAVNPLRPTNKPKASLFTYTTGGQRRAWMFTVQKATAPKIRYLRLYPSTKGKTFITGRRKYLNIKTAIKNELPVTTLFRVLDDQGKTVFRKTFRKQPSKAYTLKWNGKPSKGNGAGLKTSSYVPAGKYTVQVKTTMKIGGKSQDYVKERKLTIANR